MVLQLKIYAFSIELKLAKLYRIQCLYMKYIICSNTTNVKFKTKLKITINLSIRFFFIMKNTQY